MPLARHEFTVTDEAGNIVTDAQVEVRSEAAGNALAVLYSDRDGTTPLGNPFNVDGTTAVAAFHVIGGAYRIRAFKTGFERIARYVGIGTAGETDAGLLQTANATAWAFDDSTAASDPGSGVFRLSNATPASATAIYVDNENAGGNSVTAWLDSLDDGGDSADRGTLHICDPDQPTEVFRLYRVTAVADSTGYRTLTVSHIAGAGSFTAAALYSFTFAAKGNEGDVPDTRTVTAGSGLTGGGALSSDITLNVGAGTGITVNADDVAIDKASDANVRAAASNKVLTSDLIESASAIVSLTETAGSIAVDWDTFINGDVIIDENSTLSNPSNGQAGTWRTIVVRGNDGTDRTLSFGANYHGDLPTLTDIDSGKQYILMIYCVSTSQFTLKSTQHFP